MPAATGPLRVVDLFCGAGGLTQGFKDAGCEVVFALDSDPDAMATYNANHPEVAYHLGSIVDLSPQEVARVAGRVDVVVGGPSCQGFSTANRSTVSTREHDERNDLWTHMLRIVEKLQPKVFLLENVPGMVHWEEGGLGALIRAEFEARGYTVEHDVLLAADYGVPQRRRRLFIVGTKRKARRYVFPEPTHHGAWRRDRIAAGEDIRDHLDLLPHLSVWEAIADLPEATTVGSPRPYRDVEPSPVAEYLRGDLREVDEHKIRPLDAAKAELVAHVPQGGTWRDIPAHLLPPRFLNMRRTDSTNVLGRLDPSLPSYTITTQFGNVTVGCNTHPFEPRALSVREAARLQTFPDRYEFHGTGTAQARQIGNAVPPLLAHTLAWSIATHLRGERAEEDHAPAPVLARAAKVPLPSTDPGTGRPFAAPARIDVSPLNLLNEELGRRGRSTAERPVGLLLADLVRNPDLVFADQRVAVFVNGCFIHGCEGHGSRTRSTTFWWAEHIARHRATHATSRDALLHAGYRVVTVWEHQSPSEAADAVLAEVCAEPPRPLELATA